MSDEKTEMRVPMIAATSMLRPPPARIGKISENFVLPRAIEARKLFAGLVGAILGITLWLILWAPLFGLSLLGALLSLLVGAAGGLAFITLSPIRGESMYTYMQLRVQARRGTWIQLDGKPAKAFIGIAPLPFRAQGPTRMLPGAVDVLPGTVDERGVPVSREEKRRTALEQFGGQVSAPRADEGFSELSALGQRSVLEEKPHRRPTWNPAASGPMGGPPVVPEPSPSPTNEYPGGL